MLTNFLHIQNINNYSFYKIDVFLMVESYVNTTETMRLSLINKYDDNVEH